MIQVGMKKMEITNGPTWVAGKIGGALSFDGVDDHLITHNFFALEVQILEAFLHGLRLLL